MIRPTRRGPCRILRNITYDTVYEAGPLNIGRGGAINHQDNPPRHQELLRAPELCGCRRLPPLPSRKLLMLRRSKPVAGMW